MRAFIIAHSGLAPERAFVFSQMAHDVFLSYSSKDKAIADGICANIEAAGIRCWIAPRDIAAGDDWPTAIANAIAQSRIMVLIFSANSNSSDQISRELSLAANANLVILPFKIENVMPEPGKLYYLARTHWLDAMNPPTQAQINLLVERVSAILASISESKFTPKASSFLPLPATVFPRKAERPRWLVGAIVGVVGILVVGALAVALAIGNGSLGLAAQAVPSAIPTKAPTAIATFIPSSITTPTITLAPTNTQSPTKTSTSISTPARTDYLVEERFNGVSIDSSGWRMDTSCTSPGRATQANEILSITGSCTMTRRDKILSATEMAYAEIDLRVSKPQGNLIPSPEARGMHGFLKLQLDRPNNFIQCKLLVGFPRDYTAPYFTCGFKAGEVLEYEAPFIKLEFDTWYKSRIEIDPNTSEIRFFLDGKLIGNYTPKDANFAKSALFTPAIGEYSNVSDVSITSSFDNFVIRNRLTTVTPTPTPIPTRTDYLVEERFSGDVIDSSVWGFNRKSPNSRISQADGVLRITGSYSVSRRAKYTSVEMQYAEVDFLVNKPQDNLNLSGEEWAFGTFNLIPTPYDEYNGCQFGFWAGHDATPYIQCIFGEIGKDKWTSFIALQFDTWYKSRIEIDPDASEIRFFLDGKLIGRYPAKDANVIKSAQFEPYLSVNYASTTREILITISFDNFVIRKR